MTVDERQWPIERFIGALDELKTVLGADVAPSVDKARHDLITAIAERDRGNRGAALTSLARAMAEIAQLGDRVGPAEGAMMRAVTAALISGLARADREEIERNFHIIQGQAGEPISERQPASDIEEE